MHIDINKYRQHHTPLQQLIKQAGVVDNSMQKQYSAALSKYLLEQDENLLNKPRTQAVLKGAIDNAAGHPYGLFTLPGLSKALIHGGVYAGVAVPTVLGLGSVFGASAPVQKRLAQLGVLGAAAGGLASVLGEDK